MSTLVMSYYRPETGEILGGGTASLEDLLANQPESSALMAGHHDPAAAYVLAGEVTLRPDLPACPVTGLTVDVSAHPAGTRYFWAGASGGEVEVAPQDGTLLAPSGGAWLLLAVPPFPYRGANWPLDLIED